MESVTFLLARANRIRETTRHENDGNESTPPSLVCGHHQTKPMHTSSDQLRPAPRSSFFARCKLLARARIVQGCTTSTEVGSTQSTRCTFLDSSRSLPSFFHLFLAPGRKRREFKRKKSPFLPLPLYVANLFSRVK